MLGVGTGVPVFALLVTIWRLYYRIKRKLAWWDDLLVGLAALWMSLLVTFIWVLNCALHMNHQPSSNPDMDATL
jgi:hypothetical protein